MILAHLSSLSSYFARTSVYFHWPNAKRTLCFLSPFCTRNEVSGMPTAVLTSQHKHHIHQPILVLSQCRLQYILAQFIVAKFCNQSYYLTHYCQSVCIPQNAHISTVSVVKPPTPVPLLSLLNQHKSRNAFQKWQEVFIIIEIHTAYLNKVWHRSFIVLVASHPHFFSSHFAFCSDAILFYSFGYLNMLVSEVLSFASYSDVLVIKFLFRSFGYSNCWCKGVAIHVS